MIKQKSFSGNISELMEMTADRTANKGEGLTTGGPTSSVTTEVNSNDLSADLKYNGRPDTHVWRQLSTLRKARRYRT